jgi:hypothetical protein
MPLRKQGPGNHTFKQADLKCEQRDIDQLGGIAYEHRDISELDVKGETEMVAQLEVRSMLMIFERMLQDQLTMTVLRVWLLIALFNAMVNLMGEISHYMRDYRVEMVHCGGPLKLFKYQRLVGSLQMAFKRRSKSIERQTQLGQPLSGLC